MFQPSSASSSKPLALDLSQGARNNTASTLSATLFGAYDKPLFSPANTGLQSQQQQPEIATRTSLIDNSPTIPLFPNHSGAPSRTTLAPSFFLGSQQTSASQLRETSSMNDNGSLPSASTHGKEKRETLPGFLSESCNPKAGQKRTIHGGEERRVLLKTTGRETGLFAQGGQGGFGMDANKSATTTNTTLSNTPSTTADASIPVAATTGPPVQSMWDQRNLTIHTMSTAEPKPAFYDSTISKEDTTTTIVVFGFPSERVDEVKTHFRQFGEIDEARPSNGNWIYIRYTSPFAARAALKCNGTTISDDMMIGVRTVSESSGRSGVQMVNIVPFAQSKDMFKKEDTSSQIGLGSGRSGVSVLGCKDVGEHGEIEKIKDGGLMNKVKEALFGW